jgi:hypothetical protein
MKENIRKKKRKKRKEKKQKSNQKEKGEEKEPKRNKRKGNKSEKDQTTSKRKSGGMWGSISMGDVEKKGRGDKRKEKVSRRKTFTSSAFTRMGYRRLQLTRVFRHSKFSNNF